VAIKGKKKSKGGRPRAAAPKATPIVPAEPFFQRKGVQVALASIATLILGLGLGYGFGKEAATSKTSQLAAATNDAAKSMRTVVEQGLKNVGTAQEDSFDAFPDLAAAIEQASTGNPAAAKKIQAAADAASARLEKIKVPEEGTTDPAAGQDILAAKAQLISGLQQYSAVAANAAMAAADPTSKDSKTLLASAADAQVAAAETFQTGYRTYLGILIGTRLMSPPEQSADTLPPGLELPEGTVPAP